MRLPSLFTQTAACILAFPLVSAQSHTSEQSEAQISNPNQECTNYTYAPVAKAFSAGQFPTVWTVADILPGDTNALAKYQSIQSQIPNISPNGIAPGSYTGNWSNWTYSAGDPNCWWSWDQCTTPKHNNLPPDTAAVPEPNTLGYAFDDGPNCTHNLFYDFLKQNNQTATMFYIGSNVADWPYEAQRGLVDGHEICVHTWSHRYMTALNNTQVFAEFYYSTSCLIEIIKLVIGYTPTCWRPPFGDVDDRVRAIANALGLRTVIWKYDSNDWRVGTGNITAQDVDNNYQALIQRAQNGTFNSGGTIMLTHELNNYTMSEAIKYYAQLKAAFAHLVPINVALNISHPYVETNYTLPNFDQYVAGTTSLSNSLPIPTQTGSSTQSSSHANAASPSFRVLSGVIVTSVFVGSMLRLLL